MMPTIRIPSPLGNYASGETEVFVQGDIVAEALPVLLAPHPALKTHFFPSDGNLQPFVHLFLGDQNFNESQYLTTPLKKNDRLLIVPSIAGGS